MSDDEFDEFAKRQAAAYLSTLAYEPLRELPWLRAQTASVLPDVELSRDVQQMRTSCSDLVRRLRQLGPEVDSFSLPLDNDLESLSFNEVVVEAQRYLLRGAQRIESAIDVFQRLGEEGDSTGSELSTEDLLYAASEKERRRNLAIHLAAYANDPKAVTPTPLSSDGLALTATQAGTLSVQYALDAASLDQHLQAETDVVAFNSIGDVLHQFAGVLGANGSAYLRRVTANLERARKRGARLRSAAVTAISIALLFGGVFLDRFLGDVFGGLLWLSLGGAVVLWVYDLAASTLIERQTRVWRLNILAEAVRHTAATQEFLRIQQSQVSTLRQSIGRPAFNLLQTGNSLYFASTRKVPRDTILVAAAPTITTTT